MSDPLPPRGGIPARGLSRRSLGVLSVGAGFAQVQTALAKETAVIETDVTISTPDGACDAALFHPSGEGPWPGVVMFADIRGLRPAFREMARRLAGEGYTVLVPNPFYRTRKAPVITGPFDFSKPEDRAKMTELTAPLTTSAKVSDGVAYVAFLDATPQVDKRIKIGLVGYCMGGPYTLLTAAAAPVRVGACGSFHGAALVTDKTDSPHTFIPRIDASFYFGIASNDDKSQPDAKNRLRQAFASAGLPAKIEVYTDCLHGWCTLDNAVYNRAGAEQAYAELTALFAKTLVPSVAARGSSPT